MLSSLQLNSFKNYTSASFVWDRRNIIVGPNGSGKTNILEAIYLLVNAMPIPGRTMSQYAHLDSDTFSLAGGVMKNSLEYNARLGCDIAEKTVRFLFQWEALTKTKYREAIPGRAVFFSPIEMNILYLGPSLRRDMLDEALLLAFPSFQKVRRDYMTALRNRNALLKGIREGRASRGDLVAWNTIFIQKACDFYAYRTKLLASIEQNRVSLEVLLEGKYALHFEYVSRIDFQNIEDSMRGYLDTHTDRDIITGHTSVGPHLDDFIFSVDIGGVHHRSDTYLSRGENKTILIGLKFLMVRFIEERSKRESILLLDDLFSELDSEHIDLILQEAWKRQIFITSQISPTFLDTKEDFIITEIH